MKAGRGYYQRLTLLGSWVTLSCVDVGSWAALTGVLLTQDVVTESTVWLCIIGMRSCPGPQVLNQLRANRQEKTGSDGQLCSSLWYEKAGRD